MVTILVLVAGIWYHAATVDDYQEREEILLNKMCETEQRMESCKYETKKELNEIVYK